MEQHINVISLSDDVLRELHKENNYGSCRFESKEITHHGGGFYIDKVVFKEDDKYFQYLAISYLDEQYMTYTKPYEVFKEETTYTRTSFTSWIED